MVDINYVDLFKNLPPEIAVMFIALIPIAELRVSIPVALGVYKMSISQAIFWSVLADVIISAVIIYFLDPIHEYLCGKAKWIDNIFEKIFARTRKKFVKKYETWGSLALMIFVAIPLPITGAWTGSLASWLFGISKKRALFYVSLGVIISAVIVTLISLGLIKSFYFFIN